MTEKRQDPAACKSGPKANRSQGAIQLWTTSTNAPATVVTQKFSASEPSPPSPASEEEEEFPDLDAKGCLAVEKEISARTETQALEIMPKFTNLNGWTSSPERIHMPKSIVPIQVSQPATPSIPVSKPKQRSIASFFTPQPKPAELARKEQTASQSHKAVIYEALKEDMCHEVVPLELLPASFLAHLLESDERQKQYLFCKSKGYTPVRAILAVVDPQKTAQQRHAHESLQQTTRVQMLRKGVITAISRDPLPPEPRLVLLECGVCKRKATDRKPQYLVDSNRYILSVQCSSGHGAMRAIDTDMQTIKLWTITRRINAVLQKSGLMSSNTDDIARIAQSVKSESLRNDDTDARILDIKGTKGINDLRRGPRGNDPKQIEVICQRCVKTRTMDKAPLFHVENGKYLARHFVCKESGCKSGSRGNVFIPYHSPGTRQADKIPWMPMKRAEHEVNGINKAAKVEAGVMVPPPKNSTGYSYGDIKAMCQKKPDVKHKVTICQTCKRTEFTDTKPLFYQDTDGLKYLALVRAGACSCWCVFV
ncbi:hypothetical protein A1O7_07702 [Cladophialophora yegresii CBS 114405]|uniref:Uncharacterized protein n=1 Tax=Cladophialophora yegresii CBS 114405 TaxID=1182544 RepID=W9VXD4_9EURO|nr:uncharacterized protein A1O7_07702 [Cladophialophora yegresii CBS 114405]EXJ57355.1 hypothetical protein A1O7_07702 [Cladophialophora yegresii CBS 114405]